MPIYTICWYSGKEVRFTRARRNLRQLYLDLVELGYRGSCDRVAAYARISRHEQQVREQTTGLGSFVPLSFAPGEAFQFDWSEDWAVIGGERTKLQVAQFKLSYSRAFMLLAYLTQSHEMLFDAHNHAHEGACDSWRARREKLRTPSWRHSRNGAII